MKRGFTPAGGRPGSLGSAPVTASPTSTSTTTPWAAGSGSPITASAGQRAETATSTPASTAEW